jgi:MoaA/NifB/PqqE/SkfB family radical SAM enzyme
MVQEEVVLGPDQMSIHPTNACQLNCIGCWHYSALLKEPKSNDWRKNNLTLRYTKT